MPIKLDLQEHFFNIKTHGVLYKIKFSRKPDNIEIYILAESRSREWTKTWTKQQARKVTTDHSSRNRLHFELHKEEEKKVYSTLP